MSGVSAALRAHCGSVTPAEPSLPIRQLSVHVDGSRHANDTFGSRRRGWLRFDEPHLQRARICNTNS